MCLSAPKKREHREVEHEWPLGELREESRVLRRQSTSLETVAVMLEENTDNSREAHPYAKAEVLWA